MARQIAVPVEQVRKAYTRIDEFLQLLELRLFLRPGAVVSLPLNTSTLKQLRDVATRGTAASLLMDVCLPPATMFASLVILLLGQTTKPAAAGLTHREHDSHNFHG